MPSPSELASPSPCECPYLCEDLPICRCHEGYNYESFGQVCPTHCMAVDHLHCHAGTGTSLEPCTNYGCPEGQVRCRRVDVEERGPEPEETGYFLAEVRESCFDACRARKAVCDADLINEAARSPAHCRDVLGKLGVSVALGGQYDDDNSGCTYHPDSPGWYQVLLRDSENPVCEARNADPDRQRVCACQLLREERTLELGEGLGDQNFCIDASDTTSTVQGKVSLGSGAGSGGAFTCNCKELCELHNLDGSQSTVTLTNYMNNGAANDFRGTVLQISIVFVNNIEGAVFTFDALSALEIHSGATASFTAGSTFNGDGAFRAREGSVVTFSSVSIFQVVTEVSGQFLIESNTVTFEQTLDLSGSNALMHVQSGSRLVATSTVTITSSSEIRGTSGTMDFSGGLSMASSSRMTLTQTTMTVTTWTVASSTLTFVTATVATQSWSMSSGSFSSTTSSISVGSTATVAGAALDLAGSTMTVSSTFITQSSATVVVGEGSSLSVAGGAQLDASTLTVSSSTSTFTAVQASTLTNGGNIQGRGGANMEFSGGLATTTSTMDLQQTTVSVTHLQMSTSTLTAGSSTAVTATQVTLTQTTVQMTSTTITSAGGMSDTGGTVTLTTSVLVVTTTFVTTSSTYSLSGSSVTVTQHTMTSTTIALTDASSQFLLDGGGAGGGSQVGTIGDGSVISGPGSVKHKLGQLDLAPGSTIESDLELSPGAQITRAGRALQQTDLTTTNPAATACGNSIGATTVASGASLSIDTSCSFGSESWDVLGTTSTYTTSVAATGAVDVQSGGLLVLNTVTVASNAFSITGTFTLSGSMEVLVTDTSTTGSVILMKWDDTSCTDITSSVTVYGCTTTSCSTEIVPSGAGTSCYLRLAIGTTSSSDSNHALYGLFALLVLIPICGGCIWYVLRHNREKSYDTLSYYDDHAIAEAAPGGLHPTPMVLDPVVVVAEEPLLTTEQPLLTTPAPEAESFVGDEGFVGKEEAYDEIMVDEVSEYVE